MAARTSQRSHDEQVREVRRMLVKPLAGNDLQDGKPSFDRRIGYALTRRNVTVAGDHWGNTFYKFNADTTGRLASEARQWVEAEGMKDLADAYDQNAIQRYVARELRIFEARQTKLMTELAEVDARIAELKGMLP